MYFDWCLDDENVLRIYAMDFYSAIKKNKIMKFGGKWVELKNSYPEWGNLGTEKQMLHICSYIWILSSTL